MGAKRLGGKRPGGKRLGGETTRGGNGLGAKRPGFLMCTCDLSFEEKYYFSPESLLYIAYACFCNILINKHLFIGRKKYFQKKRKWKERNKVNFCLLFYLFVFASFHSPVHSYIRVEN